MTQTEHPNPNLVRHINEHEPNLSKQESKTSMKDPTSPRKVCACFVVYEGSVLIRVIKACTACRLRRIASLPLRSLIKIFSLLKPVWNAEI